MSKEINKKEINSFLFITKVHSVSKTGMSGDKNGKKGEREEEEEDGEGEL